MELTKILLAAITTTVVAASCTKAHDTLQPTPKQQTGPVDTLHDVLRGDDDGTFLCLGCGRG